MSEDLSHLFRSILDAPIWGHFELIPASAPTSGNVFSFSEYLAALALLLVVMIASDFRFRYRLLLTRTNLQKVGFWVGLGVGATILTIEVWFQNGLPIPRLMANANNLKAVMGLLFLTFVFWVISVAIIRPPVFKKRNAQRFFETNYHFIHEGNDDRIQVIAEELRRSLHEIIGFAAKAQITGHCQSRKESRVEVMYAHAFLLLLGDKRFCRTVVDKIPAFGLDCVEESKRYPVGRIPIFQFVRHMGQEFVLNKNSALYQERSGYDTGFFGYERPVSTVLYGSYEFVERCARNGGSPLEVEYHTFKEFDEIQMDGFSMVSLAFIKDYLQETKGRHYSNALTGLFRYMGYALSGVYEINGIEKFDHMRAYTHLYSVARFIDEAIELLEKGAEMPRWWRVDRMNSGNIFDELAKLIIETIFAASTVSSPVWTAWQVQHNTVWTHAFGFVRGPARKVIAFKVRRLLYDEIRKMDELVNFRGARLLGFCLNILGLKTIDRHKGFQREFYSLQAVSIGWIKANYSTLLAEHPDVAEACLQGRISYDSDNRRLVQTYSDRTGREPPRDFLYID